MESSGGNIEIILLANIKQKLTNQEIDGFVKAFDILWKPTNSSPLRSLF